MKKQITEDEKLQILGLLTLARQHYAMVAAAEKAMAQVLDHDEAYVDWLSDAISENNESIDEVLKKMEITVLAPKQEGKSS